MSVRLIKGFFVVLAGLFLFITILSLFIPSKLMVTRAVVINAPAEKVFREISDLQHWKHWQPVFVNDSAVIKFYTSPGGTSDSCEWNSKGKTNQMQITKKSDFTVSVILKRAGEHDVKNNISVLPLADTNQVQVEWNVLIQLKWYPWEKFYGILIEKISGEGYEASLNSLKAYVEQN